jgi:hypothetical protein
MLREMFNLPGRAEVKVALHLLDRRDHPCYVEIVKQQISCSAKSWFSICYNRVGLGGG